MFFDSWECAKLVFGLGGPLKSTEAIDTLLSRGCLPHVSRTHGLRLAQTGEKKNQTDQLATQSRAYTNRSRTPQLGTLRCQNKAPWRNNTPSSRSIRPCTWPPRYACAVYGCGSDGAYTYPSKALQASNTAANAWQGISV
jgi:hypothetical protein